jgi:hypothetical protein
MPHPLNLSWTSLTWFVRVLFLLKLIKHFTLKPRVLHASPITPFLNISHVILPCTLLIEIYKTLYITPTRSTCLTHYTFLDFMTQYNNIWLTVKFTKFLFIQFFVASFSSFFLHPRILLRILSSPSNHFLTLMWYKTGIVRFWAPVIAKEIKSETHTPEGEAVSSRS